MLNPPTTQTSNTLPLCGAGEILDGCQILPQGVGTNCPPGKKVVLHLLWISKLNFDMMYPRTGLELLDQAPLA